MRATAGVILAAIAALGITACGGGSGSAAPPGPASSGSSSSPSSTVPLRSETAACREFRSWYQQFGSHGRLDNTGKMVILQIGISEAPPGQLRQDLSILGSDVIRGSKATGSLGQAKERKTVDAAHTVVQDCQAVTPQP
jgi:hypothetical protein